MKPPEPPPPVQGQDTYPRVVAQVEAPPASQLVTFALPGLLTAVVRVPQTVWINQDHLGVSGALQDRLSGLLPPTLPDVLPEPPDDVSWPPDTPQGQG